MRSAKCELIWRDHSMRREYFIRRPGRATNHRVSYYDTTFHTVQHFPNGSLLDGPGWYVTGKAFDEQRVYETREEAHIYVCSMFELEH